MHVRDNKIGLTNCLGKRREYIDEAKAPTATMSCLVSRCQGVCWRGRMRRARMDRRQRVRFSKPFLLEPLENFAFPLPAGENNMSLLPGFNLEPLCLGRVGFEECFLQIGGESLA